MGLSLGAAALAFAGGAAKQINQDADRRGAMRARMKENTAKMKLAQKLRVQESDYVNRQKRWETDRVHATNMKSMTADERQWYIRTEIKGQKADVLATRNDNGEQFKDVSWTFDDTAPTMKFDNDKQVDKFNDSISIIGKMLGKTEQDEIEDEEAAPSTGKSTTFGGEGGSISTFLKRSEVEKTPLQEASERLAALRSIENPTQTQLQEIAAQEGILGKAAIEGQPDPVKSSDAVVRLQEQRDKLEESITAGTDVTNNKRKLDEIEQQIDKQIAITGTTEQDPRAVLKRRLTLLQNRFGTTQSALKNIDAVRERSKASIGGVPGLVSGAFDFVATNYRGIAEGLGFLPDKTGEERFKEIKELDKGIEGYLDNDLAALRGASRVAKSALLYDIAGVMRETGRKDISAEDVRNAKVLLSALSNSDTETGALIQLEDIVKTRQREIARDIYTTAGISPEQKRTSGRRLAALHYKVGDYVWDEARGDYIIKVGLNSKGQAVGKPLRDIVNSGIFDKR